MYLVDQNGKKQEIPTTENYQQPIRENYVENYVENYSDKKSHAWLYWLLGAVAAVAIIILIVWLTKSQKGNSSMSPGESAQARFGFRFF